MNTEQYIKYLIKADPILGEAIRELKLRERKPHKNYFMALVRSIIGQQLSVKAADTIMSRVTELFHPKKFPTPEEFLAMPDQTLRHTGLSGSKISYIKNVAQFILKNKPIFKTIHTLPDEEIISLLTKIKGIGRWTAEMFLIFTLGRLDVFSHGDLGLQNAIVKIYKLRKKPNIKKTTALSSKWKPYRSIASLYLWESLNKKRI